ncbi:TPA: SEC10/PgrA surface exclusion domain-containing protein [Streptococcus suis]|nr:SEC10/PgrA surface exclusion domain-containing protein [Streptococcus suis]
MNKKDLLKTVTIASAILAAGAISFSGVEASADTLDTTPTTANETETPTTNQVTEEQVAAAKAEASAIGDAVKHQETVVADALTTKQSAQAVEAAAQTELVAAQETAETATPEAVQAVETEIVEAEAQVAETETLLETANQEASTAQVEADEAQAVADAANTAYTEAQTQALVAKTKLDNLINTKYNAISDAQKEVAKAESVVFERVSEIETAELNLQSAQIEDAKLELEISNRQTALDRANSELVTAQQKLDEKSKVLKQNEQDLASSKIKLDQTKADLDLYSIVYPQEITVSEEWKDAFKTFLGKSEKDSDFEAILNKLSSLGKIALNDNKFITNDADKTEYDPNNLPDELLKDLNRYAITLINSIHKQMNDGREVVANENIISFAKDVSIEYKKTSESNEEVYYWNSHNVTAINRAASKNGLFDTSKVNLYENLQLGIGQISFDSNNRIIDKTTATRSYLYEQIFNAIQGMMLYDYGTGIGGAKGGHARSIYDASAIGVALSQYSYKQSTLQHLNTHILQVPRVEYTKESSQTIRDYWKQQEEFRILRDQYNKQYLGKDFATYQIKIAELRDKESEAQQAYRDAYKQILQRYEQRYGNTSPATLRQINTIESAKIAYEEALLEYNNLRVQFENYRKEVESTITNFELAKKLVAEAQRDLEIQKLKPKATPISIEQLAQAQSKLKVAQTALTKAQANLEELIALSDENENAIEEAQISYNGLIQKSKELQVDVAQAKSSLDTAQSKLNVAQSAYINGQLTLANAKQAVEDAKAKLLGLQEAEANLVKAQEAYDKAVKAKDEACAVYQTELAKLTELKNSFTLAANHYLTLSNLYKLQEQVKAPTEETGDNQGTGITSETPTPNHNPNGTNTLSNGSTTGASQGLDVPSGKVVTAKEPVRNLDNAPSTAGGQARVVLTSKTATVKIAEVAPTSKEPTPYRDVAKAPVQAAALPQTGSKDSILPSLAGLAVLGFGLSHAIKRRKYTEE